MQSIFDKVFFILSHYVKMPAHVSVWHLVWKPLSRIVNAFEVRLYFLILSLLTCFVINEYNI